MGLSNDSINEVSTNELTAELRKRRVLPSTEVNIYTRSSFDDVGEFHRKMNLPVTSDRKPQLMTRATFTYRTNFLFEELREFIEAHNSGDIAGAFDALMDLAWIAMGTAHYLGVPWNEGWQEVVRANMEKRPWVEGDPIKPRNVVGLEVVKPKGWREPDIAGVLETHRENVLAQQSNASEDRRRE